MESCRRHVQNKNTDVHQLVRFQRPRPLLSNERHPLHKTCTALHSQVLFRVSTRWRYSPLLTSLMEVTLWRADSANGCHWSSNRNPKIAEDDKRPDSCLLSDTSSHTRTETTHTNNYNFVFLKRSEKWFQHLHFHGNWANFTCWGELCDIFVNYCFQGHCHQNLIFTHPLLPCRDKATSKCTCLEIWIEIV